MAKDLPYYKFVVAEWLLGRISHESYAIKGMFADAGALYWHKECQLTYDELQKKLGKKPANQLITLKYVLKDGDTISIPFLDEQFTDFADLQDKRSNAGKKGRRAQLGQTPGKENNLPGHLEERKGDKRREEDISLERTGNFLRVGLETIPTAPSVYFQKSNSIILENWKMQNPHDATFVPKVFEKMDQEYIGYDFKDENHLKKTFFYLLKQVKGFPAKNQNMDAPVVKKNQPAGK